MTNHERWIVYPLLFLTLGIALRPKFTGGLSVPVQVTAPQVRCETLTVVDDSGRPQIRLSGNRAKPQIALYGAGGREVIELEADGGGRSGRLTVRQSSGLAGVEISASGFRGEPLIVRVDRQGHGEIIGSLRAPMRPAPNLPQKPAPAQRDTKQIASPPQPATQPTRRASPPQ